MALISRDAHVKSIPSVPIVFVSGFADTCAIEAAATTDAIVVRKPFRARSLNQRSAL
jgi:hypothetical protein